MSTILGCDPGLDGALCLLGEDGELRELVDLPTIELKPRRVLDLPQLALTFDRLAAAAPTLWIEHVSSRPTDGHVSAFSFGGIFWGIQAMAAARFIPIRTVAPVKWRRAMGLKAGDEKDASRALASQHFPREAGRWALKRQHDRAEAVLIAIYGQRASA